MTIGLALLRHALTFVGGLLASKGYVDSGTIESASGAILTLAGIVWSVLEKNARPAG